VSKTRCGAESDAYPDGAGDTLLVPRARELGHDGRRAEVRGHGEVGDGGGGEDDDGKLVEDACADGATEGEEDEGEVGDAHDGKDGPQPVGRGLVDVDLGDRRVDGDGL
jgi:hypothetical protein